MNGSSLNIAARNRDDSTASTIDFNRIAIPQKVRVGDEEIDFQSLPASEQRIIVDLVRLDQEISNLEFETRVRKAAKEQLQQVLVNQRSASNSPSLGI
jgi:hypothetical protein